MVIRGRFQNGVFVPDDSVNLPDGTTVRIEVIEAERQKSKQREGGMWKGRVSIADNFDTLPSDLANAFGFGSMESL